MISNLRLLPIVFGVALSTSVSADSTLEYVVNDAPNRPGKSQPLLIKNGLVMLKGAGGDSNTDMLYNRDNESLLIIDHRKRSFMAVDQQQVSQIGQQAEQLQPLLQGFGEQLGKLSPQQKAKWQQMLGGNVSIDDIAAAAAPAKEASVVKTGLGKNVAGIPCEQIDVLQGANKTAELCVADPSRLSLSSDDYDTVRSLLQFSESLASKTQGIASQFGFKIPRVQLHDLAGVPVEIKDYSSRHESSVVLSRIVSTELAPEMLKVPNGYHRAPLTLWK